MCVCVCVCVCVCTRVWAWLEEAITHQFDQFVSSHIRMKPSCFQYAGTKDRRAITSQNITAFKYVLLIHIAIIPNHLERL